MEVWYEIWPLQSTIGQGEEIILKCLVRHALYFQETARENRNKDAFGLVGSKRRGRSTWYERKKKPRLVLSLSLLLRDGSLLMQKTSPHFLSPLSPVWSSWELQKLKKMGTNVKKNRRDLAPNFLCDESFHFPPAS